MLKEMKAAKESASESSEADACATDDSFRWKPLRTVAEFDKPECLSEFRPISN